MFRTGCEKPLADRTEETRSKPVTALRNMGESLHNFLYFSYLSVYPRPEHGKSISGHALAVSKIVKPRGLPKSCR